MEAPTLTVLESQLKGYLEGALNGRQQIAASERAICSLLGASVGDGSPLADEIQAMCYDGRGCADELLELAGKLRR
jgi:hypothetical protein